MGGVDSGLYVVSIPLIRVKSLPDRSGGMNVDTSRTSCCLVQRARFGASGGGDEPSDEVLSSGKTTGGGEFLRRRRRMLMMMRPVANRSTMPPIVEPAIMPDLAPLDMDAGA